MSVRERFAAKVGPPNGNGCREWSAGTDKHGYGQFKLNGKNARAHRVAFFFERGYWPDRCRHTCDNPPCCEIGHLVDGTQQDNVIDSVERGRHANTRKTHCPAGHPLVADNLVRRSNGHRHCRTCHNAQVMERYCRKKEMASST